MFRSKNSPRLAFALRDLIICFAVMACAVCLLLPVLNRLRSRPAPGFGVTEMNLRQVSLAVHSYSDAWRRLPPAFDKNTVVSFPVSIHVRLFPFIEQDHL